MIDSIVNILNEWGSLPLHGSSEVMARLLPLYAEAEKTATDLLWQMIAMIRWVFGLSPAPSLSHGAKCAMRRRSGPQSRTRHALPTAWYILCGIAGLSASILSHV